MEMKFNKRGKTYLAAGLLSAALMGAGFSTEDVQVDAATTRQAMIYRVNKIFHLSNKIKGNATAGSTVVAYQVVGKHVTKIGQTKANASGTFTIIDRGTDQITKGGTIKLIAMKKGFKPGQKTKMVRTSKVALSVTSKTVTEGGQRIAHGTATPKQAVHVRYIDKNGHKRHYKINATRYGHWHHALPATKAGNNVEVQVVHYTNLAKKNAQIKIVPKAATPAKADLTALQATQAQVAALEAALAQLKADYQAPNKGITPQEFAELQLTVQSLQAALTALQNTSGTENTNGNNSENGNTNNENTNADGAIDLAAINDRFVTIEEALSKLLSSTDLTQIYDNLEEINAALRALPNSMDLTELTDRLAKLEEQVRELYGYDGSTSSSGK
ncbi:hypothetical protein EQG49_11705 [Periweissella cryptocerci]|uniref:Bacterial Ig domain-containing protein n=1 Tax=Periweissella cryptocerci TaxID=2506420 RepID=A0A4P6YWA8_9LACO|nr:hypothetical protein [Periweissella cryptocerci]QBO37071.1 hypothetical protein EQG49_11705 [Periweissella cryptocerci]